MKPGVASARRRAAVAGFVVAVLLAGCSDGGATGSAATAGFGGDDASPTTAPTGEGGTPTTAAGDGGTPSTAATPPPTTTTVFPGGPPVALVAEVVATHPHDPEAFTQGLEVAPDGRIHESTGGYGESSVRSVELVSGAVQHEVELEPGFFGEGLTRVGDELVQLTWREGIALRWDAETLAPTGSHVYEGEGWGLCAEPERLVMSDGSSLLTFRDPADFGVLGTVQVTLDGAPVERLNELECVDGAVWANVWQTDLVLRIDPGTGFVTGRLDAAGLLDRSTAPGAEVMNGIAHRPDTGTFLLTGKLWPTVFEVRITEAG